MCKKFGRHISKEVILMANKYRKRCFTSLSIKEMQTKTITWYHYVAIKMAERQTDGSNETGKGKGGQVGGSLWVGEESRWFYDL